MEKYSLCSCTDESIDSYMCINCADTEIFV